MKPLPTHPATLPTAPTLALLCRWLARIASLASLALIAAFALGDGGSPTLREWIALAFFPIGVCLGMLIAWRRELLGGLVSLASLAAFYIYLTALSGKVPHGPYFLIFSSPALLFLASALLRKPRR